MSAASIERDPDVQIILRWVIGREPTQLEWEKVPELAALARIERRLGRPGEYDLFDPAEETA